MASLAAPWVQYRAGAAIVPDRKTSHHWSRRDSEHMKTKLIVLLALPMLALSLSGASGCSCGFDCNNDRDNNPAILTLGFSDQDLEQLKQVVIEVDRITLQGSGVEDVVIDRFTIDDLGLVDADSFQMDLLDYRGLNQLTVFEDLELARGRYSRLLISILGNDINLSFVQESDDSLKPIVVAGGQLSLPGPRLSSGEQIFTVEFGLAQALHYQQSQDNYLLTTEGVRLMDNATAASLSGRVDSALFDSVAPCDTKTDPENGNRIYLYSSGPVPLAELADVFTGSSSASVPAGKRAPYAVASMARDVLTGGWQYSLGFIAAGDYTLAFACDAADDNPVNYDGFDIPLPTGQVYQISLDESERGICDLGPDASCN